MVMTNEQNVIDSVETENKIEREIPDEILKKIFKDLYPTNIHKIKYIQDNPSLKMNALTKGILSKNAKKEDIDDFLVKQVPKNPKSMKQLSVDWLESKKSMKVETEKLYSDSISLEDVTTLIGESNIDDFETYVYLVQESISEKVFDLISEFKEQHIKKQMESGEFDSEKVRDLELKVKALEAKLAEVQNSQKEEVNNIKQNYDLEKEKLKNKYEQRLETTKNKYEEEKVQLIKIQGDSDRRFSDERKTYVEQIETLEKENKKYLERINSIGSDLMNQNKQNKDASKSLNRIQNRIEDLQADNKELTVKNEELRASNESLTSQISKYKKQESILQNKVQELSLKIHDIEKIKVAFMLTQSEINSIIKELNAFDDTKERMNNLLNIDTRSISESKLTRLDQVWINLIEQEEKIVSDYLSISLSEVIESKDLLKDKIDYLLDLDLNLKAREVLVKLMYEKGYKAYRSFEQE